MKSYTPKTINGLNYHLVIHSAEHCDYLYTAEKSSVMSNETVNWMQSGKWHSCNGLNTFYVDRGEGEVVVIIHGYPGSSFEWRPVIETLSMTYRVIAFDLLGMGFSDKPMDHHYSYEEYVAITLSLLGSLNIQKANFLSHDLGVSVVQELMATVKSTAGNLQIESIAFVNGGLFMDSYRPRLIQRLLSQSPDFFGAWLSAILSRRLIEKSIKSLFGPTTQPSQKFLDQLWEILTHNNGKELAYLLGRLVFKKYRYQQRWLAAMQSFQTKMCFINGPFDPNSGEHMAKRYEELISRPQVFRMEPWIGHWPHVEDTSTFLKLYLQFVQAK